LAFAEHLLICERHFPMPFDSSSNTVVDPLSARIHALVATFCFWLRTVKGKFS
jgi:hypothetical protein